MKIKDMKQVREYMKDMNMRCLFRRDRTIITVLAVMIATAGYLDYAGKRGLTNRSTVYEAGAMDISDEDILAENQVAPLIEQLGLQEIPSLDQGPSDLGAVSDADGAQAAANPGTDAKALAQAGNNATAEETTQATSAGQTADAGQITQIGADGSARTGPESPGEVALTSGMGMADYIASVQLSKEQIRIKNKETLMTLINSTSIDEAAKQQAIQDMVKLTEVLEKENAVETLPMARGSSNPVVSITQDKTDIMINAPSVTDPQRAQIEGIVKCKAEVGADQIIITLLNMAE